MRNKKLNYLLKATFLGVIGYVLMILEFPLGFFPSFLTFDFADVTSVVSGFALGPFYGVLTVLIRNVLHLMNSSTAYVGELANFIVGSALVLPASLIYQRHKNKKMALVGMTVGTLTMTAVAMLVNYFIIFPFFTKVMPMDAIIGLATAINPRVTTLLDFMIYVIAPFNLLKATIISVIVHLIYKKLSPILHGKPSA